MLSKYKTLTRTTFHEMDALPHYGVYIIAYMGRVLYVGKAADSVMGRLRSHLLERDTELLGGWMYKIRDDWHNVRLDVIEPPDTGDVDAWLRNAEKELIQHHRPLFNIQLMT